MDNPPSYSESLSPLDPPEYTPSVHHISLVYYADESNSYLNSLSNTNGLSYRPLVMEINSTQINFYNVKSEYDRIVAHLFNELSTNFVDPNLNVKSKNSSKFSYIGQGVGSSTNLFNNFSFSGSSSINNSITPVQPKPILTSNSSTSSMFSTNCSQISRSSSVSSTSSSSLSNPFSRFFDKISSSKRQPRNCEQSYNYVVLSETERKSQDLLYIHKLLNYKPDINSILDVDYTPQDAQLLNFKSHLFKSMSLQQLVKFGNASDFHLKPYTLRLILPNEQFLLVSYNANSFASIFYKLNIGRELSFDIDTRITLPLDYCVPRRSRGSRNRNRRRSRSNTVRSNKSTRSRSNSLLNNDDADDDDDEFDNTFAIENDTTIAYQARSSIQPQIILEDEILNDIIQLEPAQQIVSSRSTTSASIFSSVERYCSQVTNFTLSSLSPISSENESSAITNSIDIEFPIIKKIPVDQTPHSSYKELVFALKCIKSCKNKTIPWFG